MTVFDPATGRVVDRDALESITTRPGFRKAQQSVDADGRKLTEVVHSDDGGTAAVLAEHADGRVDVTATPRAAAVSAAN